MSEIVMEWSAAVMGISRLIVYLGRRSIDAELLVMNRHVNKIRGTEIGRHAAAKFVSNNLGNKPHPNG